MTTSDSPSVFASLEASPQARLLGRVDLGFGRSAALWRNESDEVSYRRLSGHAFSLYLRGGDGTRRVDGRGSSGRPGAVCIFPEGHSSRWQITRDFAFVHLYLPDAEMRRAFAETFDRDARLMAVPEVTLGEAPALAGALRRLAQAMGAGDALAAEAAADEAVGRALAGQGRAATRRLKGGLAPHLRRRLAEHVEAGLAGPLRLGEMAALAGLSAFHFQRMFTESFGQSPHAYVARRRLEGARQMLRGREPIAEIAGACGFSSQSHLTRAFKAATGFTPAAYRALR